MVGIAQTYQQCKTAGKNIKPLLRQRQTGKLPECTEINQEKAIDFAGLLQNAIEMSQKAFISISRLLQRMAESKIPKKTKHREGNRILQKVYNKAWNSKNNKNRSCHNF